MTLFYCIRHIGSNIFIECYRFYASAFGDASMVRETSRYYCIRSTHTTLTILCRAVCSCILIHQQSKQQHKKTRSKPNDESFLLNNFIAIIINHNAKFNKCNQFDEQKNNRSNNKFRMKHTIHHFSSSFFFLIFHVSISNRFSSSGSRPCNQNDWCCYFATTFCCGYHSITTDNISLMFSLDTKKNIQTITQSTRPRP